MKPDKLPQTDSIQELAEFYDTHDLTDLDDQFEDVTEPVFELTNKITVDLPMDKVQAVRELARSKGMTETELVREWVLENIPATSTGVPE